jgi:uncharacterized membrane protein
MGGPVGTLVLSLAGLVPVVLATLVTGTTARPSPDQALRLAVAGLMMGIGLIAFNRLATGRLDASVAIPIVDSAMLIVSTVGALWFFAEPVTVQKVVGIALLATGILLLRPS